MNLEELKAPFNPISISWRIGSTNQEKTQAIALAYLDARDVMRRLDEVCGPENWQAEYPFLGCCRIGIRIPSSHDHFEGEVAAIKYVWVWKANGAGQSDIEAEKGQYSDAFKRAAVLWGIGRYLYDLPNQWFPIEPYGRSHRFTKAAESSMTQFLHKWQTERTWTNPSDRKATLEAIDDAWANRDEEAMKKIWADLDNEQKSDVWGALRDFSAKRATIKQLLGVS